MERIPLTTLSWDYWKEFSERDLETVLGSNTTLDSFMKIYPRHVQIARQSFQLR